MSREKKYIIGISLSHNATAAVVDEESGKIIFCSSEERLSRRKNDYGIPFRVLHHILENVIDSSQVSVVVIGENCSAHWATEEFVELLYLRDWAYRDAYVVSKFRLLKVMLKEALARLFIRRKDYRHLVEKHLREMGIGAPVKYFNHHASHAASTYYCSPFKDALIVTLDGEGDRLSGSCWLGKGKQIECLVNLPENTSIGKFYRSITGMLGFRMGRHEGKVTGLAAFGSPERFLPTFQELLGVIDGKDGLPRPRSLIAEDYLRNFSLRSTNLWRLARYIPALFKEQTWEGLRDQILQGFLRDSYGPRFGVNFQNLSFDQMADVAAAAQMVFEDTIVTFIEGQLGEHPNANLALAGGVFANVKVNQRLLDRLPIDEIYIHPGMGDEGLAIGAAMLFLHADRTQKATASVLSHVFLGMKHQPTDIDDVLRDADLKSKTLGQDELIETVAEALVQEKVVGLFLGRPEYGPRALGHRTILVNPSKKEINSAVNARLHRTEFMPFAPVVLEECFYDMFNNDRLSSAKLASRFMTITIDVKKEYQEKVKGVVHIDGTARPQIINQDDDPVYYGIVKRFYEKTGIGCVVNTSFNVHEEPIVNSPSDAIRAFRDDCVDILVMDDRVIGLD